MTRQIPYKPPLFGKGGNVLHICFLQLYIVRIRLKVCWNEITMAGSPSPLARGGMKENKDCRLRSAFRFFDQKKECKNMKKVKIYQLNHLTQTQLNRLRAAQQEAAQVWNLCMQTHTQARTEHTKWPERDILQEATKGRFALHSQSVQQIVHAFLANVETTRTAPGTS